MRNKILCIIFIYLSLPVMAATVDYKFMPLRFSGFNADVVVKPGENFKESVDKQGWAFYTEERSLRGGVPNRLRGMFSDVPYVLADFSDKCVVSLSSSESSDLQKIDFEKPFSAKCLWLLFTSGDINSKADVVINYTDGTSDNKVSIDIPNWYTSTSRDAAFWQLGRIDATGRIDSNFNYALYEYSVPISDIKKEVSSLTIEMTGNQSSIVLFAITASSQSAPIDLKLKKLFFISDSHLDTQWNWTVKTTIEQYVKNTLNQTFKRFDDVSSKNFNFNFEGAIKYMWAKEYYPNLYSRLKDYMKEGKWNIAGASVDANDVNIGSAESLMRNFLYGQTFFKREFGIRGGRDIMLPDCFGFPWSLPTVASHCGMKYFHTQKLSWNSAYAYNKLPRFARWMGTDGEEILAVLKINPYDAHEEFRKDMSRSTEMLSEISDNSVNFGIPATLKYVGPRGDRGGGLDKETADWLSRSVDSDGPISVSMGSTTEMLDQVFHMGYDKLPIISHGLPMRAHGVGGYTSRCMLKFWLRKGELLAGAAEKASVAADWLGNLPYQQSTLTDAWIRLLWHQFHDDIPGTSINEAYKYSVNDQVLNQLDFSRTLNNAVGAVAQAINTSWCSNIPVIVYNPLSIDRVDIVEASVELPDNVSNIVVTDSYGRKVPSQILECNGKNVKFLFLASVPSLGYSSYNVVPSANVSQENSDLKVTESTMENGRYKLLIDENGDVCSIIDKNDGNRELLSAPIRLAMLFDESLSWPSWEIHGDQLRMTPREYVDKEGLNVEIAENGPLRISLKIMRKKAGSTFCQYIRLASSGADNRIDFVNEVNWQTRERLLKATFPLTASNPKATYDLSIGADVNNNSSLYSTDSNNTDAICEFLGHRWADVTNVDNAFGVSVLNDCKYGWDKQKDNELRLTLIHTPKVGNNYSYQGEQDLGLNKFTYSFFAHKGKWNADTQWEADKLNEPMLAYQSTKHEGALGSEFAFAKVNNPNVAIKAVKRAEESQKTIVRFYELTNQGQDVEVEFAADILSAEEVNGVEECVGDAKFSGRKLSFHIDRFHPKTYALTFASPTSSVKLDAPKSVNVNIKYNLDVVSSNANRQDADISKAFPAELMAENIIADGIEFKMGSCIDGFKNALRCEGQVLELPVLNNAHKLYILASSLNANGSNLDFVVDGKVMNLNIGYYGGNVAVWSNSSDVKKQYRMENTAFTSSHSHLVKSDKDAVYDYLYMYKYVLDIPVGATSLQLPNNSDVLIYSATLSDNRNDDTVPLSQVVQVLEHTDTEDTYLEVNHEDRVVIPAEIKASSYTNESENPGMAADGDTYTKWCDNSSATKWLEYRFNKPITVTGWRVVNAGIEGENMIASEYCLQRYVNNGWIDVESVFKNTANKTDLIIENPFVSTAVRLRIVSPEQSGKGAARVYEFDVFGHEATEEEKQTSQIISRRPTYGYGKQVACILSSSGCVNQSEAPRFILDADRSTKWCYNGSESQPNVVVELSDIYDVDRFDIYDSRTMEDYANSDEYTISVSLDGKQFSTVAAETGVASESHHRCVLSKPVAARYIKLQMGKGGGGAVRVYGFDIWGVFKEKVKEQPEKPISIGKTIYGTIPVKNFAETALNIIDGINETDDLFWNFNNRDASSQINWMVLDLEDSYCVNKLVLYDCGNKSLAKNISGLRVYMSNKAPTIEEMENYHKISGGSIWKRVASLSNNISDIKTINIESPIVGRYIKFEIPYSCVTDSAMLREIEVYGHLVSTGITHIKDKGIIEIYPGVIERGQDIYIDVPNEASYKLCNVGGKVLVKGIAIGDTKVCTSNLPAGLYVVQVVAKNCVTSRKIIIK